MNTYGNQPSKQACPNGCSGNSYIPRHVIWYRKQFRIPKQWTDQISSSLIYLQLDGSFRNTTIYFNWKRLHNHDCGYTPFNVELEFIDDTTTIYGDGDGEQHIHTLAVFVDPNNGDGAGAGNSRGSGWWYKGGGLYRHVRLIKVNKKGQK